MIAEVLNAGLGWPVALALMGMSFLASLITAGFGIGGGVLMLAMLASLLPAAAVIPVHGLVQVGSNAGRCFLFRREIYTAVMMPFVVGSLIGIVLGGLFVVQLDAGVLQIAVGLFILWSVLFKPPALMRKSAGITGVISSFLTMFFGATGPFVAAYVKSLELNRVSHVATQATFMTIQHLLKTFTFGLLGFAFSQWAGLITLLILCGFLGAMAGRLVLLRSNEVVFKRILSIILTVLALRLIYGGASSLFASGP